MAPLLITQIKVRIVFKRKQFELQELKISFGKFSNRTSKIRKVLNKIHGRIKPESELGRKEPIQIRESTLRPKITMPTRKLPKQPLKSSPALSIGEEPLGLQFHRLGLDNSIPLTLDTRALSSRKIQF
ncbi:unnamed protein product [Calypogeia fissa]